MTAFIQHILAVFVAFSIAASAFSQPYSTNYEDELEKAGIFHRNYQFDKAIASYTRVLESLEASNTGDSLLKIQLLDRIDQCHNGQSMLQFIVRPSTVASTSLRKERFYLAINDMDDKTWIPIPNPFIKLLGRDGHPYYNAMYFLEGDQLIFSAPDETGCWSLYTSHRKDSLNWSAPEILSKRLLSSRNEIFPMLSSDGLTLYFASDGLPGMGGYDLFCSRWDRETGEWSMPENLGFPYSSTGDDIFFMNSPDGRYSTLVSNRQDSEDSVTIYVLDYIATPVKAPIGRDESPLRISTLAAASVTSAKKEIVKKEEEDSYSTLMHKLRKLRNEHNEKMRKIFESRRIYEAASAEDKEFLAEIIREVENEAMTIKQQIDRLTEKVRQTEMAFLENGIIPMTYDDEEEKAEEAAETADEYRFAQHTMGRIPYLVVEKPAPKFDYTFKILGKNQGQFAEDNTLPKGLVFQIQFTVLSRKADIADLNGLSPVYVRRLPTGKYVHTTGLFASYQEASAVLGQVRKNGFKEAFIVAFLDGSSIPVKDAREMEGQPSTRMKR